jgi:AbrB family looped-hinge helix DNA binding protein
MASPKDKGARARRSSITLRDKGCITIPQDIRTQLGLETGSLFIVSVNGNRIVLTPASVTALPDSGDPDGDKAAGRDTFYATDQAFLASFEPGADGPAT